MGHWDGKDKSFIFKICGRSETNYATNPESHRSETGIVVYLCDVPILFQSVMQKHVTLSMTEVELAACVSCVQDMMYVYCIAISLGLQVKKPMAYELDNSGARDLANSWSMGGRMEHLDVQMYFLRELMEEGLIVFKHIP